MTRRWCPFLMAFLAAPALLLNCAPRGSLVEAEELIFRTEDDVLISATLYGVERENPPGLVLVHMRGSNRHSWEPFAVRAQRGGIMCIAIDLRGHGDSCHGPGKTLSYRTFRTADWRRSLHDIDAGKNALTSRGADPDNLALVGASIGANLALHYALAHADIQATVLLSPGLDYQGITAEPEIAGYGKRPLLLISTQGDSYSRVSSMTLKEQAQGYCELRLYPGAAHGTDIFAASESAMEQILLWLSAIIGPKSGAG